MTTNSQSGQDIFVRLILGENKPRTFLDIGCSEDHWSNTLLLEREGWTGTLIDMDPTAGRNRKNPVIHGDATQHNWTLPPYVDYLSLDIDADTVKALNNLPLATTRFGVITIEHDAYRFGDTLRIPERAILRGLGYVLICADVCNPEPHAFEDWWVSPELAAEAAPFTCTGKHWGGMDKYVS